MQTEFYGVFHEEDSVKDLSLEITVHTEWLNRIENQGNRLEDWLEFLHYLKDQSSVPASNSWSAYICNQYLHAIKSIPKDQNKSITFVKLLIDYANMKSEKYVCSGQTLFRQVRSVGRKFAIAHVYAAEFELKQGNFSKCSKILEMAQTFGAEPKDILRKAVGNLKAGKNYLLTDKEKAACFDTRISSTNCPEILDHHKPEINDHPHHKSENADHHMLDIPPYLHKSENTDHHKLDTTPHKPENTDNDQLEIPDYLKLDIPCYHYKSKNNDHHKPEITDYRKPEITDNKPEITDNKPEITDNKSEITDNKPEITDNKPEITDNKPEITDYNKPEITDNKLEITDCHKPENIDNHTLEIPDYLKLDIPYYHHHKSKNTDHLKPENTDHNKLEIPEYLKLDIPHRHKPDFPDYQKPDLSDYYKSRILDRCKSEIQENLKTGVKPSASIDSIRTESKPKHVMTPELAPPKKNSNNSTEEFICGSLLAPSEKWGSLSQAGMFGKGTSFVSERRVSNMYASFDRCLFNSQSFSDQSPRSLHSGTNFGSSNLGSYNTPDCDNSSSTWKSSDTCSVSRFLRVKKMPQRVKAEDSKIYESSDEDDSSMNKFTPKKFLAFGGRNLNPQRRPGTIPEEEVKATSLNDEELKPQPEPTPQVKAPVQSTPIPVETEEKLRSLVVNNKVYTVVKRVGKGGSSTVYEVFDQRGNRLAVKSINIGGANKFMAQSYKNEVTLLQRLQYSDRIIKLHDYEFDHEKNYLNLVLEFGDTDLAGLFRSQYKTEKITQVMVMCYWTQMLEAVLVLHKEGIVHSDLKPGNFLIAGSRLKLIDFGIADVIQSGKTGINREIMMGTPDYMSPEAISVYLDNSRHHKIGLKSDIWSLGCILYCMVYGKTPFNGIRNTSEKLVAIRNDNFKIKFGDVRNKELLDSMKCCLQRDPKNRLSIEELLRHPYLNEMTIAPTAVTPPKSDNNHNSSNIFSINSIKPSLPIVNDKENIAVDAFSSKRKPRSGVHSGIFREIRTPLLPLEITDEEN
ncbi:serine/threonine-protein kinase Nek7-like isoform X1 [Argonauta hians]